MSSHDSTPWYSSRDAAHNTLTWRPDITLSASAPQSDDQGVRLLQPQPYESFQVQDAKTARAEWAEANVPSAARHSITFPKPLAIRNTLTSWALEILAVAVSAASIIAIIAVLYRENGRPLTSWKFAITLNTVVAALGTLARTTLAFAISACIGQQKWNWFRRRSDRLVAFERFDEASRGPYGGAKLFFWLRLRCEILQPTVRETNTFTDIGPHSEPWSLWVLWRSIPSSRQLYPLSEDPPISQQPTTP